MLPELEKLLATLCCLVFSLLAFYDLVLILAAVLRKKDDTHVPLVYVFSMTICGLITKFLVFLNFFLFLTSENDLYKVYLGVIGPYTTVIHQLSQNIPYSICALMTIHRLVIVQNPKHQLFFQKPLLFLYLLVSIIPILLLTLLPPIFYQCQQVFSLQNLSFESQCVNRLLTDKLFLIPVICILINCFIFLHSYLKILGVYPKISTLLRKTQKIKTFVIDAVPPPIKVARVRRYTAMRQLAVSTAVFMAFCELESGFEIFWPNTELHPDLLQLLAYVRLTATGFLNLFVFQIMTDATNEMVKQLYKGSTGTYLRSNIVHIA